MVFDWWWLQSAAGGNGVFGGCSQLQGVAGCLTLVIAVSCRG